VSGVPVSLEPKWVIVEESHRVWRFERAWLLSNWGCVYGQGCRGIHPTQDPQRVDGCCTYGAHFSDGEDFVKVARFAPHLSAHQWQFHAHAKRVGWYKRLPDGRVATRADVFFSTAQVLRAVLGARYTWPQPNRGVIMSR
jgi:hypothetical protein